MKTAPALLQIKEFARKAGVTVRTLHLYDRLELLKPATVTDAGYRLYGEPQLERLEHILALRFVGFSLEEIKELLRGSNRPLVVALRMQRDVIAHQRRRLDSALAALDEAERALAESEEADLFETLSNVIEVFRMQNDWDWTRKYYSDEAVEKLDEYRRETPQAAMERGQREWRELIAEVEDAAGRGLSPSSGEARALAARWRALLAQFTRGNAAIQDGLNRLWSDSTHWPKDFRRPWNDATDAFIKKTMACDDGAVDGD